MSTIKVDKLQGTSGAVTGLTFSGANGTFGGTLAVTGVHTVGTNAVATSEGGAATTSVVQGLAKSWLSINGTGTIAVRASFNISSITDQGVGLTDVAIGNNMSSAEYSLSGASGTVHTVTDNCRLGFSTEAGTPTAATYRAITREANDDQNRDANYSYTQAFGSLA